MLIDDLLILPDGGVEVALQEVNLAQSAAGPEIVAVARLLDQRFYLGGQPLGFLRLIQEKRFRCGVDACNSSRCSSCGRKD
jgi:hypothetical protein